jgi:hypothetical protein
MHGGISWLRINGIRRPSFHFALWPPSRCDFDLPMRKSRPKAALSSQASCRSPGSVVIDDDLAAVVIDIPIVIALFDDNRVAIAVIVPVANHFAVANDIAVAVAFTDRHADRAHTDANFFCACRQRGSDERGSRYNSKT